ncbi:hypothetical protein B0H13DRAFT_1876968 [Mycena leptocephala]|nr:hypothetical protein B0H13DRAFT_1876968 [Mycena leptocephala]
MSELNMMTRKAAEEMRHGKVYSASGLKRRGGHEGLKVTIAACHSRLLRVFSSWMDRLLPRAPRRLRRHLRPPPRPLTSSSPQVPQGPYAAYPNPNPQGYHPHPNQYQRPPPPAYQPHLHPHAYFPHPQQYAPQYGGDGYPGRPAAPSIRAPSLCPPYRPASPRPHPTGPRTRRSRCPSRGSSSECAWRCLRRHRGIRMRLPPALSLTIGGGEGLGINFEFESPTAVEGGGIGKGPGGRAGELANGNGNGNGEAGEEDDESELPWARCASGYVYPMPTPPSSPRWCAGALVPCLHHHHPYREPRHVPIPTDVISSCISLRSSRFAWGKRKRGRLGVMALAVHDERANDRLGGGARVARASTVEARRGAVLDGGRAASGVWAFPAQLARCVGDVRSVRRRLIWTWAGVLSSLRGARRALVCWVYIRCVNWWRRLGRVCFRRTCAVRRARRRLCLTRTLSSLHDESAPSSVLLPQYAHDDLPRSPSIENRMLHSPCCVDGPYGSRTFSVVRYPLYEMAMGSGGTMTVSPSRRRDGGPQASRLGTGQDGMGGGRLHSTPRAGWSTSLVLPPLSPPFCVSDSGRSHGDVSRESVPETWMYRQKGETDTDGCRWDAGVGAGAVPVVDRPRGCLGVRCKGHFINASIENGAVQAPKRCVGPLYEPLHAPKICHIKQQAPIFSIIRENEMCYSFGRDVSHRAQSPRMYGPAEEKLELPQYFYAARGPDTVASETAGRSS